MGRVWYCKCYFTFTVFINSATNFLGEAGQRDIGTHSRLSREG